MFKVIERMEAEDMLNRMIFLSRKAHARNGIGKETLIMLLEGTGIDESFMVEVIDKMQDPDIRFIWD